MTPGIGAPTKCALTLWLQLREIALIAAINGHNLQEPEVKIKMLSALAGGNLLKAPSVTVEHVARQLVKQMYTKEIIGNIVSAVVPADLIFNFFTKDAAMVSTHAKALFGGENAIPIPSVGA